MRYLTEGPRSGIMGTGQPIRKDKDMHREEAIRSALALAISTDPYLSMMCPSGSDMRDELERAVNGALLRFQEDDTNPQTVAAYLIEDLLDGANLKIQAPYARAFDFVGLMWSSWARQRQADGFYR